MNQPMRWKRISDFEEYEVSDSGQVRKGNYMMKCTPTKYGYVRTWLTREGKTKFFFIHRLVANAFLERPQGTREVNHKDGNKQNNDLRNLEWVSRQANIDHAWKAGLYRQGNNSPNRKISGDDIPTILDLHKSGMSYKKIGNKYGVDHATIRDIITGKTWKSLGICLA